MSTLTTWNEAYDFGRAMLGMDEAEAEAFAEAHFGNPDALVEELHAQPDELEAKRRERRPCLCEPGEPHVCGDPYVTQEGHRTTRREMYEGLHVVPTRGPE